MWIRKEAEKAAIIPQMRIFNIGCNLTFKREKDEKDNIFGSFRTVKL